MRPDKYRASPTGGPQPAKTAAGPDSGPASPSRPRPALAQESVIRGRFRVSESSLGVGRATIESVVCASIYVRRRAAGLYRMAGVYV